MDKAGRENLQTYKITEMLWNRNLQVSVPFSVCFDIITVKYWVNEELSSHHEQKFQVQSGRKHCINHGRGII